MTNFMDNFRPAKTAAPDELLHDHEKKELRIIKQAIAKSFITSGQVGVELDEKTERLMERWIKWIYRDEEKDWRLVREREQPF